MIKEICVCKSEPLRWTMIIRSGDGYIVPTGTASRSLAVLVQDAMRSLNTHATASHIPDFTLSHRLVDDIVSSPYPEAPTKHQLEAMDPGADVTVMLLEDPATRPERMTMMWRDPTGALTALGSPSRFVRSTLGERLAEFFRTFDPKQIERDRHYRRELLARPSWSLAAIWPEAVPAPPPAPQIEQRILEQRARQAAAKKTRAHMRAQNESRGWSWDAKRQSWRRPEIG